jgi:hypothetical protein
MAAEESKALVCRYLEEVWDRGNVEAVDGAQGRRER